MRVSHFCRLCGLVLVLASTAALLAADDAKKPSAATKPKVTGSVGSRVPLAALDSTDAENRATRAMSRYVGDPARARSALNSRAKAAVALSIAWTGFSGLPI